MTSPPLSFSLIGVCHEYIKQNKLGCLWNRRQREYRDTFCQIITSERERDKDEIKLDVKSLIHVTWAYLPSWIDVSSLFLRSLCSVVTLSKPQPEIQSIQDTTN
jgi:hypothetical protein